MRRMSSGRRPRLSPDGCRVSGSGQPLACLISSATASASAPISSTTVLEKLFGSEPSLTWNARVRMAISCTRTRCSSSSLTNPVVSPVVAAHHVPASCHYSLRSRPVRPRPASHVRPCGPRPSDGRSHASRHLRGRAAPPRPSRRSPAPAVGSVRCGDADGRTPWRGGCRTSQRVP